jgi:flagellar biogenesis protein FliO
MTGHLEQPGDEPSIRTGPTRVALYFVFGGILIAIGLVGVGIYTLMPVKTPVEGNAPADAALQSLVIIGAAVAGGLGVLLVGLGIVASIRARRRGRERRA